MKPPNRIFKTLLLLVLLNGAFWFFNSERLYGQQNAPEEQMPNAHPSTIGKRNSPQNSGLLEEAKSGEEKPIALPQIPLRVFGVVEDLDGNAIPGCEVRYQVDARQGFAGGFIFGSVVSGPDGRFQIDGYRGLAVGLNPVKEGYLTATNDLLLNFSPFAHHKPLYTPNPTKPHVLKMYKKRGNGNAVELRDRVSFKVEDFPLFLDLLTGEFKKDQGDLRIDLQRPPGEISVRQKADWGVRVQTVDGVLKKGSPEELQYTYQAPVIYESSVLEGGYQRDDSNWSRDISFRFFTKSRNGQLYSKVQIAVLLNQDPTNRSLVTYFIITNPDGGNTWEDVKSVKPRK